MKMFIGNSGSGKTKELIMEAAENEGIIVCRDPESLREKIIAYGAPNVSAISYEEFLALDTDLNKKYYIRHAEKLFELMGVSGFTLTTD